jgi:hypothetical protein
MILLRCKTLLEVTYKLLWKATESTILGASIQPITAFFAKNINDFSFTEGEIHRMLRNIR